MLALMMAYCNDPSRNHGSDLQTNRDFSSQVVEIWTFYSYGAHAWYNLEMMYILLWIFR